MDADFHLPDDRRALRIFDGRVHRGMSDDVLIAFYEATRARMWVARTHWVRAMNERNRAQRQSNAALALKAIRDERAEVTSLEMARDDDTSGVLWPTPEDRPRQEHASASLAGELAIALFAEFATARRGGFCQIAECGRPWLFDKRRRLCGRDSCRLAWRNAHRSLENPKKVYERVKRYRAKRAKEGKRHDKKK